MYEAWIVDPSVRRFIAEAHAERAAAIKAMVRWIGGLFGGLTRRWKARQTVSALESLDDRALKDIGLFRGEIRYVAERIWGKTPTEPAAKPSTPPQPDPAAAEWKAAA